MKHIHIPIAFLFLAVLLIGCSSGDDTPVLTNNDEQTNNDPGNGGSGNQDPPELDPDGDGVESTVEATDGTDPQDPCSYLLTSQDYGLTTEDWRNLDCDGDGVTNGDELDPDGNNQNEGNGTDPLDLCSFNPANQTVATSALWNSTDCDQDCQTNFLESLYGTDPLDPEDRIDFEGKIDGANYLDRRYDLTDDGKRLQYVSDNDGFSVHYNYEADKLDETYSSDYSGIILRRYAFSYSGDNIDFIEVDDFGLLFEISVEYDGNIITSDLPFTPSNQLATRLELDPQSNRVIREEKFSAAADEQFNFTVTQFQYDENWENLNQADVEEFTYDSTTGQFDFVTSYSITYTYHEGIVNPFYEAYSQLELAYRLTRWDDPISPFSILSSYLPIDAMFSKSLVATQTTSTGTNTFEPNDCAVENEYPFNLRIISGGNNQLVNFFYSPY